jgi:hypothetical protein
MGSEGQSKVRGKDDRGLLEEQVISLWKVIYLLINRLIALHHEDLEVCLNAPVVTASDWSIVSYDPGKQSTNINPTEMLLHRTNHRLGILRCEPAVSRTTDDDAYLHLWLLGATNANLAGYKRSTPNSRPSEYVSRDSEKFKRITTHRQNDLSYNLSTARQLSVKSSSAREQVR